MQTLAAATLVGTPNPTVFIIPSGRQDMFAVYDAIMAPTPLREIRHLQPLLHMNDALCGASRVQRMAFSP